MSSIKHYLAPFIAPIALSALMLSAPAIQAQNITLKVIGQPLATGNIQKNREQPFFEQLAAKQVYQLLLNISHSTPLASRTPNNFAS